MIKFCPVKYHLFLVDRATGARQPFGKVYLGGAGVLRFLLECVREYEESEAKCPSGFRLAVFRSVRSGVRVKSFH